MQSVKKTIFDGSRYINNEEEKKSLYYDRLQSSSSCHLMSIVLHCQSNFIKE